MIYLLIFYWIFAALFCFGTTYVTAKAEEINIFGLFISYLIIGGVLFPIYLGSYISRDVLTFNKMN